MSAGLAASTVTPGNTAPVVSRTVPAMDPVVPACANARVGSVPMTVAIATPNHTLVPMEPPRGRAVTHGRAAATAANLRDPSPEFLSRQTGEGRTPISGMSSRQTRLLAGYAAPRLPGPVRHPRGSAVADC